MDSPATKTPLRFALMASGRGSNALNLLRYAKAHPDLGVEMPLLVVNREDSPLCQASHHEGAEVLCIPHRELGRKSHEAKVLAALEEHGIQHLLLAGYMRILSPDFVRRFDGAILNIHPSLLPAFPGTDGIGDQWRHGAKVVGATVHFVDAGVDTGRVILQGSIERQPGEGRNALAARVLKEVEHVIYPRALRHFVDVLLPLNLIPQKE